MHLDGRAILRRAVDLGGQGARRVDDDEIAFVEETREFGEGGVDQRSVGPGRHEHPHGVAGHAAVFGRRGRLELGGQ